MADDITGAAPIPGLHWRDATRDRDGGSRSPFRRHPGEGERDHHPEGGDGGGDGHSGDQGDHPERPPSGEVFAEQLNRAYRTGQSLGRPVQGGGRVVGDETSVLGLPARLMTPRIQEAITGLMTEMDSLRARLDADVARARTLSDLADGDGVLPVLNRWALIRDLDGLLDPAHGERAVVAAYFYLDNFGAIRRGAGLEAALAALSEVAVTLLARGGLGDLVGTPGGAALLVARQAPAEERRTLAAELTAWGMARRKTLESKGFPWSGLSLPLRLDFAVRAAQPGEGATAFLSRLGDASRDGASQEEIKR